MRQTEAQLLLPAILYPLPQGGELFRCLSVVGRLCSVLDLCGKQDCRKQGLPSFCRKQALPSGQSKACFCAPSSLATQASSCGRSSTLLLPHSSGPALTPVRPLSSHAHTCSGCCQLARFKNDVRRVCAVFIHASSHRVCWGGASGWARRCKR